MNHQSVTKGIYNVTKGFQFKINAVLFTINIKQHNVLNPDKNKCLYFY